MVTYPVLKCWETHSAMHLSSVLWYTVVVDVLLGGLFKCRDCCYSLTYLLTSLISPHEYNVVVVYIWTEHCTRYSAGSVGYYSFSTLSPVNVCVRVFEMKVSVRKPPF